MTTNKDETYLDTEHDRSERKDKFKGFAKETMLELIENDDGQIMLKDVNSKNEALVTIEFSDKIKDMLGSETQIIGQHMIHAAIQVIMQRQISQWHAHVYDEEPARYS